MVICWLKGYGHHVMEILRSAVQTRRSAPVNNTMWLTSRNDIKDHKTSIMKLHSEFWHISDLLSQWAVSLTTRSWTVQAHLPSPGPRTFIWASALGIQKTHPAAPCMGVSCPAWHLSQTFGGVIVRNRFSGLLLFASVKNPQTSQTCNGKSSKHWNPPAPVGAKGVSFCGH